MKHTHILILSGLLLGGCCSQRQVTAIDRVQSGTDTAWDQGLYVLHVTNRNGSSLEGVRIISRGYGEEATIVSADTGSISQGPSCVDGVADDNAVKITLQNARSEKGKTRTQFLEFFQVLHR